MRETTERPEAVEAGTVKLVGTDQNQIVQTSIELLENLQSLRCDEKGTESLWRWSSLSKNFGTG